ncbi:unnamed protein product [Amoebophrya sp. A120]|nr:unnamed protein product [Amoebophrya sp. A120]|eukprot:GSA120T00000910001.1
MKRRDRIVTEPYRHQEGRSGYAAAAGEDERAETGEFHPENRSSTEATNRNCCSKNKPLIITLIVIAAVLVIGAVVAVVVVVANNNKNSSGNENHNPAPAHEPPAMRNRADLGSLNEFHSSRSLKTASTTRLCYLMGRLTKSKLRRRFATFPCRACTRRTALYCRFRGSSSTIAGPRHQDQAEREISANKKKTRSSTSPHLKKAKKRKNKSRKSSRHRRGSSSSSLGSSGAAGGPRAESSSSRRRRHRRQQSSSRGEAGRSTKREDHHFEAQGDHGADESSFRSHAQHSSKTRDAGGRGDGMEIHSGDMTSPNFSTASKTPVQHRSRSSKGDKKKRHKSKKSRKSHNTSSSSDTDEHNDRVFVRRTPPRSPRQRLCSSD